MEKLSTFVTLLKRRALQRNQKLILFEEFLTSEKFFNFLGFSLLTSNSNRTNKFRKVHFYLILFGMAYFILHSAVSFLIFMKDMKNFSALVENLGYISSWNVLFLKAFWIFFYQRENIREAIEILQKNFTYDVIDQYIYKTEKYAKELKLISWVIIFSFYGFGLNFLLFIFEHQIYGWITSQELEWQFAIAHYYPFETSNSFAFWLIFIIDAWIVIGAFTVLSLTELIYADVLLITSMEFDILAQEICEIDNIEDLKNLLKIQQELNRVTKILEEIFSPILWIDNFAVIGVLCVAAFQAVTGVSPTLVVKFSMGVLAALVQGFVQCYFAQKLLDSSRSLKIAAYNTPWYNSEQNFRKDILTLMTTTQNGQQLSALKFFKVSMETYYWIMQTARSCYLILLELNRLN